jgi:hypothetical protein
MRIGLQRVGCGSRVSYVRLCVFESCVLVEFVRTYSIWRTVGGMRGCFTNIVGIRVRGHAHSVRIDAHRCTGHWPGIGWFAPTFP